ncbi:MAG TPA: hypothetical protein VKF81_05515 [Blastocatellia bacterium]|nr:hypothetical protein [Blastocatellia bacterium]
MNNAVKLLDGFLSKADPGFEGKIIYGAGRGHRWMPFSEREIIGQVTTEIERARK